VQGNTKGVIVRFVVLAIICFIIGIGTLGTGVAQRTFLAGPDKVTLHTVSRAPAPVVVIDGAALNSYRQTQNVRLSGSTTAFAAYGRTSDVLAWVGTASYNKVSLNKKTGQLQSTLHSGKTATVPNPSGSDLWLQQFVTNHARNFSINIPTDMSVIAVSDGKMPAPSDISLNWPIDNSAPMSGLLILIGAIALLIGLILLMIAFYHLRRTRGPRRSQPRMPKLPRQPRLRPQRKEIASSKGRRSIRNFAAIVPTVGVSLALLSGCTAVPTPTIATPASTPSAALAAASKTPAVTTVQLQQIMQSISSTVANADARFSDTIIKTRMAGPALADRLANYTIRQANPSLPASIAIPAGQIKVNLPQASNTWPRTVFTVLLSNTHATKTTKATTTYTALMLIQDNPRANYKVNYAVTLEPNIKFAVAPAKVGTARLDPDTGLFKMQPAAIAPAYGEILDKDTAASSYSLFQSAGDTFRTQVGAASKKAAIAALPATASLTYANSNGSGQVIVLATTDSGAIVAVDLNETETVKPVQAGAAVSAPGGAIQALSGKANSTSGLMAVYGDQLLFYVPAANKSSKIVLLGYGQGLISAKEL
jgi:hypothetical protein